MDNLLVLIALKERVGRHASFLFYILASDIKLLDIVCYTKRLIKQ